MAKPQYPPDASVPQNYEGIVNLITRDYPKLSPGYQQIARFFTQNPNVIALESINGIAEKCGVHPSSLVRFAQNLGYSGFKQLQGVFQTRLATAAPGSVTLFGTRASPNRWRSVSHPRRPIQKSPEIPQPR